MVEKAWEIPWSLDNSMDIWQFRIRTLKVWAANEVASQNKLKVELSKEFTRLEGLAESRELSHEEYSSLRHTEDRLEQICLRRN